MGELHILLYEPAELGDPGSLESITGVLDSAGIEVKWFRVTGNREGKAILWKSLDEANAQDFSEAYELSNLTFFINERDQPPGESIVASIDLGWDEAANSRSRMPGRYVRLATDGTAMFSQGKYGAAKHCERLLGIAELLYRACRPSFGWIERDLLKGYTTKKHIAALEIPHIYWANFFGPAYLEKYGRSHFEAAPGLRCQFLDDGGCLYVLSPDINRNRAGMKALEESVKAHFGVQTVRKVSRPRKQEPRPDPENDIPSLSGKGKTVEEIAAWLTDLIPKARRDE